ncbi:hypothetical protein KI688_001529 [Linnemannia hyalina]|uniref:MIT domain-containing protein n=1 Tax=Linnemannia hyalina TaxID=64524 RepID=A0A9P7XSF4_9FUNG|nr:hypothetical protein KI688_001529 [Linnemannia hyalina]
MASSGPVDPHEPYSASSSRSTNYSRRRTESLSSNVHDSNNSNNSSSSNQPSGSTSLMPPDQTRPRSSSSSKALLTMALLEAQSAVQLDNAFDIPAALDAYRRAVTLLSKVMDASSSPDEQERLRTIHDSYLFRIHLLSTPPTTSPPSEPLPALPQPPPPQQPLPTPPRQSTVASMTPATSTNTISSSHQQGYDSDSTTLSNPVAQGPSPRRVKKNIPLPLHPASVALPIHPPTEPRTPRQRSDSTSASELGSPGHTRHHTRSHTGGSIHRMTGGLVDATEQLHLHSQHRIPGVPKVRSRDHLGVPIHSAPLGPLPPTPTALGPPPSTPPPVPIPGSAPGSTPSTPSHSNPTTPNMPGHQTFLPTSPPPRSPLPQTPSSNPVSPPASPAHATRRISPLVPSTFSSAGHLHQNAGHSASPLQKSFLSSPESSPDDSNDTTNGNSANDGAHSQFYEGEPVSDEWLPNLSSKDYSKYDSSLDHASEDPYPRDRVTSKGSYTGSQLEQIRTKVGQSLSMGAEQDGQRGDMSSYSSPQQPAHQRSYSQSSTLSSHQVSASQSSRSPLSGPMYNFQAGSSSISSLHALEGSSHKRTSDSSRSLKGSSGAANGQNALGTSSPLSSTPQLVSRSNVLQHQSSSSKLSSVVSNASSSPSLEKSWSPNMSGAGPSSSMGGMTLFEVISDDPFAGMQFPLPPPSTEPPPSDPTLRCFWLMRRIEQSMLSGGFVTKRMYVPRAIWYQSLVRLPAADSKISACQTLVTILTKMAKINMLVAAGGGPEGDVERMTVLKELDSLETAAHQVQVKLSKKLSFIHRPGKSGVPLTVATNQSYTDDMQGPVTGSGASVYGAQSVYGSASLYGSGSYDFLANEEPMPGHEKTSKKGSSSDASAGGLKSQWKSFSKSVQKSMGNDKVEDTSAYTEAIIRLFQSGYILEAMIRHYSALSPFHTHIQILNRLRRMCDIFNQVFCAFVIRDMGELMGKYVKRVGAWVAD